MVKRKRKTQRKKRVKKMKGGSGKKPTTMKARFNSLRTVSPGRAAAGPGAGSAAVRSRTAARTAAGARPAARDRTRAGETGRIAAKGKKVVPAKKPAAKKPAAKKLAAKKPAGKKPAGKKLAAKKDARAKASPPRKKNAAGGDEDYFTFTTTVPLMIYDLEGRSRDPEHPESANIAGEGAGIKVFKNIIYLDIPEKGWLTFREIAPNFPGDVRDGDYVLISDLASAGFTEGIIQYTTINYLPLFNTRGGRLTAIDPNNPVFVLNDSEKRIDITLSNGRGIQTGVLCQQISNDGQDWGDTWATKDDLGKLTLPATGGRAAAARRPSPDTRGAAAPAMASEPARASASQTIILSNKVTARKDDGSYKRDIPSGSNITIYSGISSDGRNNEKVIEAGQEGRKRSGIHYWVDHAGARAPDGSKSSWVSEYDLKQAGAHFPAAGGSVSGSGSGEKEELVKMAAKIGWGVSMLEATLERFGGDLAQTRIFLEQRLPLDAAVVAGAAAKAPAAARRPSPDTRGAATPAMASEPARASASQTIILTNKVTARKDDGSYKRDIPSGSNITIYSGISSDGRNNEKVIEAGQEGRKRSGIHYWVDHAGACAPDGSKSSWVSEYDLKQAGAHFPAAGGAPGPAIGDPGAVAAAKPARSAAGKLPRINFYSNKEEDTGFNRYYELTNYWDRLDKERGVELDRDAHPKGTGKLTKGLPARLPAGEYLFYEGDRGWRSSEHRFQVHKCLPGPNRQRLYDISHDQGTAFKSPGIGPDWASKNIWDAHLERPDWDDVKMKVMYNTLLLKFRGNRHCHNSLERTRDRLLVEHAGTHDPFWGDGAAKNTPRDPWNVRDFQKDTWNGVKPHESQRGYNWLGLLLMQIRDLIFGDNFCKQVFGVLPFDGSAHGIGTDGFFHDKYGIL